MKLLWNTFVSHATHIPIWASSWGHGRHKHPRDAKNETLKSLSGTVLSQLLVFFIHIRFNHCLSTRLRQCSVYSSARIRAFRLIPFLPRKIILLSLEDGQKCSFFYALIFFGSPCACIVFFTTDQFMKKCPRSNSTKNSFESAVLNALLLFDSTV